MRWWIAADTALRTASGKDSGGDRLDLRSEIDELQNSHVDFGTRVVDVDAYQIAARVVVDDDVTTLKYRRSNSSTGAQNL